MWLFIVIARRKREKRVLSLAQYYHNTLKVRLIIINTINIDIKLKLQKLLYVEHSKIMRLFLQKNA